MNLISMPPIEKSLSLYSSSPNLENDPTNSESFHYDENKTFFLDFIGTEELIPSEYEIEPKDKIFKIRIIKDRGVQSKLSRKIKHSDRDIDNLLTKIQVHFFSFIIDISNEALFTEFREKNNDNFKKIDYKLKRRFSYSLFEKYKSNSIKNILKFEISQKYKNYSQDYNEKLLNKVIDSSNWLNRFFNMNYLKLFDYYYNNQNPLNKIIFEGKEILLSKKTKTFSDLLEKNSKIKNELIQIVKDVYYY